VYQLLLGLCLLSLFACRREEHAARPVATTPDYKKGLAFWDQEALDSAYYYFNKVVTGSKDSLQIAIAYNSMAAMQSDAGDYFGSQETLLTSLRYLHEGREDNQYCLVSDYNELGSSSVHLQNYDAAIEYYDKAVLLARDEGARVIALNDKAIAYQEKKEYGRAAAILDSILVASKKYKKQYPRVLTNLASVRWLADPRYVAAGELLQALQIRRSLGDDWGLNSSFAHLSDYYLHSRPDSALYYSRELLAMAKKLRSPDDELQALRKVMLLGPVGEIRSTFLIYYGLKDSLEKARARAKGQFALIRYESEKNKLDNLRLQREAAERRAAMILQRALGVGIIAVLLVFLVGGVFWYNRRKRELAWEKERAIGESRLAVVKQVHDLVANGVYRLMTELEHRGGMDRGQLLDRLDSLYRQSRDISYDSPAMASGDYSAKLVELLGPFRGMETKVSLVGNDGGLWDRVGFAVRKELEAVLLELMINMKKHSGAGNVVVKFGQEGARVVVEYSDDGVGLPADLVYGNGLMNTENRILGVGGRIIFERNSPKGVRVRIDLPMD